jgi:hypothetical protein
MAKTLRITFSGICTRAPGHPRKDKGESEPERVFVLMPAARTLGLTHDKTEQVALHHAFIYVPTANLRDPPDSTFSVDDEKFGHCDVYLIDHVRVVVHPTPPEPKIVHAVTVLRVQNRPGSRDIAPEWDARWLADLREILPDHAVLLVDPRASSDVSAAVAMIVEFPAGTITANFPCKTVQPQEFRISPDADPIGEPRVFACEFIVTMEYPDDTTVVKLVLSPLSKDIPIDGISAAELELVWGSEPTLEIRIGNDTLDEIVALRGIARCNTRETPRASDNDFDLHYLLLDVPNTTPRPRPFNGDHQTMHNGCVPLAVSAGGHI